MPSYVPSWLLLVNLVAFAAMGLDKKRAVDHKWRIPEKRLFLYVLLGGGIGGTAGMFFFRHKTKHWYFRVFFPLITVAEYGALLTLLLRF
ncbi:MAG: DUF1294 domain-containing protein [Lachnospiraceae bacterium]|nr:DUF1294 domain-containing protein [Lachnospiraceae bacterium]